MEHPNHHQHVSDEDPADRPECFGDHEKVCPKDDDGFIQPQEGCVHCQWVRSCLQAALEKIGKLRFEKSETSTETTGVMRFLKRWSDQKLRHSQAAKKERS